MAVKSRNTVLSWSLVSMARYTYSIPGKSSSPCPVSIFGALHDKPQVPVGEETGEREGRDVHVLPIDRRVPPFLTLLIHFPAFGAAGGTEVEGIGTQEKLLDEFLGERDFMIFDFTINSCGLNNKVVFLRRKDLNTEDYERLYFKKRVLRL